MNPIEDIVLNNQMHQEKKGKGIKIFLILVILGIVFCCAYWYYISYVQETPKSKFFKYIGQNNFNNILDIDIYYTIFEKINKQSHKTETTLNYTTTKENEMLQGIDASKLEFIFNTNSNKENTSSLLDASVNYSSNNLFNLKLMSTQDSIGIGSAEVLDKYIATSKPEFSNSIERTIGYENELSADVLDETMNNILNNKIDLEEEYRIQKIREYSETLYNLVPEETITENENVIVTINSQTINAKAYTLDIKENEYKEILKNVITKLKNDKDFLSKIVTGAEKQTEVTKETVNQINSLTNIQVKYTEGESEKHQTALEVENVENNAIENLEIVKDLPDENLVKDEIIDIENTIAEEKEYKSKLYQKLMGVFFLKQKIEGTVDDLIKEIDLELSNINNLSGNLVITVYVRNEEGKEPETIKIIAEILENAKIDIEYPQKDSFKITFLEDKIENEENNLEGISFEIKRNNSDIKTEFNIQVNNIKNKKVIAKTQVELETEGTKTSNKYSNKIIVKYNDSQEDFKLNIKNEIEFENVEDENILNDENAIFIDKLSDEDVSALYNQISEKVIQLFFEKLMNLNFINSNTQSSTVEQPIIEEHTVDKSLVRQKLIDAVSNMMGQAQQNGETFTIQDLEDLQIDEFNVSCIITEDEATINIAGYTFRIDKNFMLYE